MLVGGVLRAAPQGDGRAATLPDSLGEAVVDGVRPAVGTATATPVQRLDSLSLVRQGVADVADALRRFSGVNVRDYGGAGGLKTVSVRGLGAAHTVVTYDGLSVSDVQTGQTDLGRFALEGLGEVRLSTVDADALLAPVRNMGAAVVALCTARPGIGDRRLRGSATLRQASFSTYNPSFVLHQGLGPRTVASLSGRYLWARNDYPFHIDNGDASADLRRTNSRMQEADVEANVRHTFARSEVEAKLLYYNNHRRLPGMVHYYVNENDERQTDRQALGQMRWTGTFGRLRLMAAGKYDWKASLYDNHSAQYAGGVQSQHYWQREAYVTAGAEWTLTRWLQMAYATDFLHASLNSNIANDHAAARDAWLQALSLRAAWGRLTVQARAVGHLYWNRRRGARDADDQQRLVPTVAATLRLVDAPLRLHVRTAWRENFRVPTFTELYYYHLGSTRLRPERARQLSAGLTLSAAPAAWLPSLTLTADAYANRVRDRITAIPYSLHLWRMTNMGRVDALGVDLNLNAHFRLAPRHDLVLTTAYSWQQRRDCTDPSTSSYHKQTAYTPRHSGSASIAWDNPWLSLTAHVVYASERWANNEHYASTALPAYAEVGFSARRSFGLRRCRLTLSAELLNAFDARYEVIRFYPMPGRAYALKLQVSSIK